MKDYPELTQEISKPAGISQERGYLDLLKEIVERARVSPDRTGTGRIRVFARDLRFDLSDGTLPVVTTRKINIWHGIDELLWMISGSSNVKDLPERTKMIWDPWSVKESHVQNFIRKHFDGIEEEAFDEVCKKTLERLDGSIGPMYGAFWRNNKSHSSTSVLPFESLLIDDIPSDKRRRYSEEYDEMVFFHQQSGCEDTLPERDLFIKTQYFESHDQLGEVMRGIRVRPFSARHILTTWLPQYVPFESVMTPQENVIVGRGALTACHVLTQFFVEEAEDGGPHYLSLRITQRSCDMALGVCTNLVFYGMFLHLVAHCTFLRPKELVWSGGDCHLYANHLEGVKEQLQRTPYAPPTVEIDPSKRDLFAITAEDIMVHNYQHHPAIKYPVSV